MPAKKSKQQRKKKPIKRKRAKRQSIGISQAGINKIVDLIMQQTASSKANQKQTNKQSIDFAPSIAVQPRIFAPSYASNADVRRVEENEERKIKEVADKLDKSEEKRKKLKDVVDKTIKDIKDGKITHETGLSRIEKWRKENTSIATKSVGDKRSLFGDEDDEDDDENDDDAEAKKDAEAILSPAIVNPVVLPDPSIGSSGAEYPPPVPLPLPDREEDPPATPEVPKERKKKNEKEKTVTITEPFMSPEKRKRYITTKTPTHPFDKTVEDPVCGWPTLSKNGKDRKWTGNTTFVPCPHVIGAQKDKNAAFERHINGIIHKEVVLEVVGTRNYKAGVQPKTNDFLYFSKTQMLDLLNNDVEERKRVFKGIHGITLSEEAQKGDPALSGRGLKKRRRRRY